MLLGSSAKESRETGLAVYMSAGGEKDWTGGEVLAEYADKRGVEVSEQWV